MAEYTRENEFEEKIVQVNRVSKKTAGGNKIGFSVLVVAGDKKGRVGVGLGKAVSVAEAIRKGSAYAKKHLISIPMVGTTIPHEVYVKRGAAKVMLKPASKGTGVIAGGAVRAVVEAAGIRDILSKVLGTSNQASNVYATMEGLTMLRHVEREERPREVTKPAKAKGEKETVEALPVDRALTKQESGAMGKVPKARRKKKLSGKKQG
jgi:small subunit ribosomal protein S5